MTLTFLLMFSAACSCTASDKDRIDPQELQRLRDSLDSYLSRIRSCRISYQWRTKPLSKEGSSVDSEREVFGTAEILEAFPRYARKTVGTLVRSDGTRASVRRESYYDGSTLTVIQPDDRAAMANKSATPEFWDTPRNAVGLRVNGSFNMALTELLADPDCVRFGGKEVVDGIETIVLAIGPGIPEGIRPPGLTADVTFRICLAPEFAYMPKRWRWDCPSANLFGEYENLDIRPAPDHLRAESMPFPRRIVYRTDDAVQEWTVQDIEINPAYKPTDFAPTVPDGYALTIDGRPVRRVFVAGETARQARVSEITADARKLLASGENLHAAPERSWVLPAAIVGCAVSLIVGVVAWRRLR